MTRLLLISTCFIFLFVSCTDTSAHRPANPFIYTILNNAAITDGKDTIARAIEPGFAVNEIVDVNEDGTPWRVLQIDSSERFRHMILPIPEYGLSTYSSTPNIFKVYHSGDTLLLAQTEELPKYPPASNNFKEFKRAKSINPQTGRVVNWKVENTHSVGDTIYGYTILELSPFTETIEVEFPEEIEIVSSNPAHPDLMQVHKSSNGTIELEFFHPKK